MLQNIKFQVTTLKFCHYRGVRQKSYFLSENFFLLARVARVIIDRSSFKNNNGISLFSIVGVESLRKSL